MKTKKAYDLELGDRVLWPNGMQYEIKELSENKSGKIKVLLFPFRNSMSASKKATLKENEDIILA